MRLRRRGSGGGLVLLRAVVEHRDWPKGIQKVRRSAFPGQSWPHDVGWSSWFIVIATWDGRPVGFVMLRNFDDCIDLNDLGVHADYQHRGIGYAICADAVQWMRELGFTKIRGLPISAGSSRVFARLGFTSDRLGWLLELV